MAGKIHDELDEPAGKLTGSLEKPASDELAGADTDTSAYDSYDAYSGGGGSGGSSGYGGGGSSGGGGSGGSGGSPGSGDSDSETDVPDTESEEGAEDESDFTGEANSDDDDDAGTDDGENGSEWEDDHEFSVPPEERIRDDDDTGNGQVSVDIEAMTRLVVSMERARDQIPGYQDEFRTILGDVELTERVLPETDRLPQVVGWIEDELPGLHRRLALARVLAGEGDMRVPEDPSTRVPVTYDETPVLDRPPRVSVEHAQAALLLFTGDPEPGQVAKLIAALKGNQHDPYFAHELANEADPAAVAAAVDTARSDPNVDPARVDELTTLIEATVDTARRGTGDLAPSEDFEDRWAQYLS